MEVRREGPQDERAVGRGGRGGAGEDDRGLRPRRAQAGNGRQREVEERSGAGDQLGILGLGDRATEREQDPTRDVGRGDRIGPGAVGAAVDRPGAAELAARLVVRGFDAAKVPRGALGDSRPAQDPSVEEIDLEGQGGVSEVVLERRVRVIAGARCVAQDAELAGQRVEVKAADGAEPGGSRGRGRDGESPGAGRSRAGRNEERRPAVKRVASEGLVRRR